MVVHPGRRRIPARQLARNTAQLLDEVQDGATFEVTRGGRLLAVLAPIDPAERDLAAAVDTGLADPSLLDDDSGTEVEKALAELAAIRREDPARTVSRALAAMRAEDDR